MHVAVWPSMHSIGLTQASESLSLLLRATRFMEGKTQDARNQVLMASTGPYLNVPDL